MNAFRCLKSSLDGAKSSADIVDRLVVVLIVTIVLMPIFSAVRGFDAGLGRLLMGATDVVFILLFLFRLIKNRWTVYEFVLLIAFVWWFSYTLAAPVLPDLATLYQGFRKSMLFLVALSIGSLVRKERIRNLETAIFFSLLGICMYGVKQSIVLSDYDLALLSVQTSDLYTNYIDGRVRAFSVLSSGFHLGMAASVLFCVSLYSVRAKILSLLYSGLAVLAVAASLTRTFILVLAGTAVIWLVRGRPLAIALLIAFGSLTAILPIFEGNSLIDYGSELASDKRFTNRSESYVGFALALTGVEGSIFTGYGPGSAGSGLGGEFLGVGANWIEPHNIFLKYVFEFGLPLGVVIICAFLYKMGKGAVLDGEIDYFILSLCLIILIPGLVITSVEAWPVAQYIGLLVGAASSRRSHESGYERGKNGEI